MKEGIWVQKTHKDYQVFLASANTLQMAEDLEKYGLGMHGTMILEEYRMHLPVFEKIKEIVLDNIQNGVRELGVYVTAIEARVKTEASLAGKLELKGAKYEDIFSLTDIVGARVITFYSDEVDKISSMADHMFDIDWQNSVDKRKMHELDSFGYNSLHYICRIPKSLYFDPEHPEINEFRFELQMRTALQHVWATMYHDTGYKSGVEVPREYLRNLNRLAGMLELTDEQFSIIRTSINDYRRKVTGLVSSGKFDEVPLNGDTFRSYLGLNPFDKLNKRIAAINQAEIHPASFMPFFKYFKAMGLNTLGDIEAMKQSYSESAYQLAVFQLGNTDIDIISSTVGLQDICIVAILAIGGGSAALKFFFDTVYGESDYNQVRAARILEQASKLNISDKK